MNQEPTGHLLEAFLCVETPEGFRAELVAGEIVVSPLPDLVHNNAISHLVKQVNCKSAVDMDFAPTGGLAVPGSDEGEEERYIPDAIFAPTELHFLKRPVTWAHAAGIRQVPPSGASWSCRSPLASPWTPRT